MTGDRQGEDGDVAERDAEQIQRDIEQARVTLANSIDQIAYRTNPKRVVENTKASLIEKAKTPQGKAIIGGAGAVVVVLIIRRVRKHGDDS
jgi:hypothetical protein